MLNLNQMDQRTVLASYPTFDQPAPDVIFLGSQIHLKQRLSSEATVKLSRKYFVHALPWDKTSNSVVGGTKGIKRRLK